MKKYNILVFPAGTEIANEIINSLKNHKYFDLVFASSESNAYCNFRNKEVNSLSYVSDKSFLDDLRDLISRRNIDFIIPAHDDVAYKLSQIDNIIDAQIIGQSKRVNDVVRFKDVTYNYFSNILPIAKLYDGEISLDDFPIFVKPKRGQGSQNSQKISSFEEYRSFFLNKIEEEFVLMEYLTGTEFTVDCFSDKSKVLYYGARTREKTSRGIATQSTFISCDQLNQQFRKYAELISESLNLEGIWFYQMKLDKNKELKLLEIGARVSGTMMLNRARGINFVELALYQKLGFGVNIAHNNIEISLARALVPIYKSSIKFENLYVDFDDTLFLNEKDINTDLIKLIFQIKNECKKVYLITKNSKRNLAKALHRFGILNIFDEIIHLQDDDKKVKYMKEHSILIDDSFAERKEVIDRGLYAVGVDSISTLFRDKN